MLVFPSMLTRPAIEAGMKVPPNPNDFDPDEYPHFSVFCCVQLERRMIFPGEHWENAKIVADVPEDEIRKVTISDLISRGLSYPV